MGAWIGDVTPEATTAFAREGIARARVTFETSSQRWRYQLKVAPG